MYLKIENLWVCLPYESENVTRINSQETTHKQNYSITRCFVIFDPSFEQK